MTRQEEKKTHPQSMSSDFESILNTIQDVYYRADSEGYLTIASRSLALLLGYPDISECLGRKADTFYADPAKRELFLDTLRSSGKVTDYEVTLLHRDGSWVIVETSSHILLDPDNNYIGVEGTFRDITERKQMELRLHQALRARTAIGEVNRLRYELSDENSFHKRFCEILVSVAGYRMAWIGKKEANALRSVTPVASAGDAGEYLTRSLITWGYDTTGMGPTGTAIRTENTVICKYIQTDPFFTPWREEAIERGYASSIAIPIRIADEIFGSLNIYSAEPDAFDAEEQDLLEELTRDLAAGIASIRDRQIQKQMTAALHKSEEKYHQLFQASVAGFALHEIICDQSGTPVDYRFLEVNPAFERLTGLSAEDIIGQTVLTILPGLEHSWIETYGRVALTGETIRDENYSGDLNKYYDVTAYSPVRGQFVTLFLDITERRRAEKALLESEERLRLTLDAINDGIWDWNIPSGNVFFSARWYTM
ncbi:MAG: PAS domain S-box protein, partial [Methanobacteriota archaeon]